MKRFIKPQRCTALLLALFISLVLAACGGSGGQVSGGGSDGGARVPVELVIYTQTANFSGELTGWSAEVLKERFNVKVIIIPDADGTFATRMESGNLGDIVIFGSDGGDYEDAYEAGMLYDWEEDNLIQEYGPYILENMPHALEKNRNISGGKLYGFGHDVAASADNHSAFFYHPDIRWDLYEKLGKPEINTLEDFIPVLEEMVKMEPVSDAGTKTYGVSSFPDWDGAMVMMVKATGALYGYDEHGLGLYDTKTQTFEGCLEPNGMYLRALKFYNALYQKGLYDPDSMTQTYNDMIAKYTNGAAFFNIFDWMASTAYNSPEHLEAGKAMFTLAAKDQKNLAYGLNVFGKNRVWAIGAKTNYPELCMEIINWFATPEGVLTYNYGPQGLMWDYNENGDTYLTELGLRAQKDKKTTQIEYGTAVSSYEDGEFQHNNTVWDLTSVNPESKSGENFDYKTWKSTLENDPVYEIQQSWRDYTGAILADEYLESNNHLAVAIGSTYSESKRNAELETTWTQVSECVKAGSWSAIYAKTDEEYNEIVAKMISDAKAYGYDECIKWSIEEALKRKAAEDEAK